MMASALGRLSLDASNKLLPLFPQQQQLPSLQHLRISKVGEFSRICSQIDLATTPSQEPRLTSTREKRLADSVMDVVSSPIYIRDSEGLDDDEHWAEQRAKAASGFVLFRR